MGWGVQAQYKYPYREDGLYIETGPRMLDFVAITSVWNQNKRNLPSNFNYDGKLVGNIITLHDHIWNCNINLKDLSRKIDLKFCFKIYRPHGLKVRWEVFRSVRSHDYLRSRFRKNMLWSLYMKPFFLVTSAESSQNYGYQSCMLYNTSFRQRRKKWPMFIPDVLIVYKMILYCASPVA